MKQSAVVVLFMALFTQACSTPKAAPAPEAKPVPAVSTAARVALQPGDLPRGFSKCAFSGDMATYINDMRTLDPIVSQQNSQIWEQFQADGATAGYAIFYGNAQAACDGIVSGEMTGHTTMNPKDHPAAAFSFVIQFKDEMSAANAYHDDIFGQSKLSAGVADYVTSGIGTGLGPMSVVETSRNTPVPESQSIWQSKTFDVYFGSENLSTTASGRATAAIDNRIRTT